MYIWQCQKVKLSYCGCSVGKSTLLTMLTGTHSEAASYEFTTLTCIPGIIHYNDTKIQLLDLPGIIEGASEGKGRGRQVKEGPAYFSPFIVCEHMSMWLLMRVRCHVIDCLHRCLGDHLFEFGSLISFLVWVHWNKKTLMRLFLFFLRLDRKSVV